MSQIPVYILLAFPLVGAFAMFALGIVVIYQASRVLNLAHGAMAMIPAFVLFELSGGGIPLGFAFPVAVGFGALIGLGVERIFVRGLRRQGATGQTVGTVAALGLLVAVAAKIWGTTPRNPVDVFPKGGIRVGASILLHGRVGLFATALIACAALFALFRFTHLGLAMRGAADNRQAASLMGIDPNWTTRIAWLLGGALAAMAGILLAAVTTLHPYNLTLNVLPGFVAALIGGLASLPGALVGSAIVGMVQGMIPAIALMPLIGPIMTQAGTPQLVLTVLAFIVMSLRGERFSGGDVRSEGFGLTPPPAARGRRVNASNAAPRTRRVSPGRKLVAGIIGIGLVVWPFLGAPFSILGDAIQAAILLIVAVSIVLLTGWVGQISLAQATFVGIGAFTTGLLSRALHVPFPLSLPLAAGIASGIAAMLGIVALRVRGLYLAVGTLIFVWMGDEFLFRSTWLVGAGGSSAIEAQHVGRPEAVPFFDLSDRRTFYYVAIAAAAAVLWGAANLRDSKTGRAFAAVRGSEIAAASLGIDVIRYKLLAFALSGFLAGTAGNLLIVGQGAASNAQFSFTASLFFLAVAVVGGLTSLGGAVAAAVLFAALQEVFFRVHALAGWLEIVSAGLLAIVLLAYPGGLASVRHSFQGATDAFREWFLRTGEAIGSRFARDASAEHAASEGTATKRGQPAGDPSQQHPAADGWNPLATDQTNETVPPNGDGWPRDFASEQHIPPLEARPEMAANFRSVKIARGPDEDSVSRLERPILLETQELTVRFGGLISVDGVSLDVREGEIVGLIGPNGAGKTTIFNAVSGLVLPAGGTVRLFGRDVNDLPVHARAGLGLARTFQLVQLFPGLSVFENVLVATHLRNPTGAMAHVSVSRSALLAEHACRQRARAAMALLDLENLADRPVSELSFGALRMVEVARALVTGAPLIMLDEPASGLDNAETDRLSELLFFLRTELDVTILLIEHDVRMVTGVSDHMYVIDRGRLLAQGRPEEIRRHPGVVAAYLGDAAGVG